MHHPEQALMERESSEPAHRWVVHGRVQGVGFRYFTLRKARDLKVNGRVRNLVDGTVEILARGEAPRVDLLKAAVERGPAPSRVIRLESTRWHGPADWKSFEIEGL